MGGPMGLSIAAQKDILFMDDEGVPFPVADSD